MTSILRHPLVRAGALVTALVHAALATWIAGDAHRTGRPAIPWALATLVGGLFSVAAYKLRRG